MCFLALTGESSVTFLNELARKTDYVFIVPYGITELLTRAELSCSLFVDYKRLVMNNKLKGVIWASIPFIAILILAGVLGDWTVWPTIGFFIRGVAILLGIALCIAKVEEYWDKDNNNW